MTWATSVPNLVFLGLSVLDLGPMYATDVRRQIDVRRASSLNAPTLRARYNNVIRLCVAEMNKPMRNGLFDKGQPAV